MQASWLRSWWIKLYSVLITAKISLFAICLVLFHRKQSQSLRLRKLGNKLLRWWSRQLLRVAKVNYTIHRSCINNFNKISKLKRERRCYILMSNHCSFYDIPLILLSVAGSVRMLAKQELFRIPIWGWGLRLAEFIPIHRKNMRVALTQLEEAKQKILNGIILWVSPEGTRSYDGRLKHFKRGGFKLAQELNAIIIPIRIAGSHRIWPLNHKGRAMLDQQVDIYIGHEIDTALYQNDELGLMSAVRRSLEDQ